MQVRRVVVLSLTRFVAAVASAATAETNLFQFTVAHISALAEEAQTTNAAVGTPRLIVPRVPARSVYRAGALPFSFSSRRGYVIRKP